MDNAEKLQALGYKIIKRGFPDWFRCIFKIIEQRPFIVEPIHKDLFNIFDDIFQQKELRTNINLPPRSAKTTLSKYLLAYGLTINPKSNFIYTSYSQTLLNTIATEVRDILENPTFKAMFPQNMVYEEEEVKPQDEFWAEYLQKNTGKNTYSTKKIITYAGGTCLFASVGSQITGMGCFSYDTLILTEDGYKNIGDVVENKYKGKIWSYNFKTKKRELQPIYDYIKNTKSNYLKLTLDNGEIIYCTPDHIFYLKNGEEIRADELRIGFKVMSNPFKLGYRYSQFISNIFTGIVFIQSVIDLFLRKIIKVIIKFTSLFISLITDILGNLTPNATTFNITNRTIRQIILICYLFIWTFIFCNSNSNFFGDFLKFAIGIIFILHIFFSCTIAKIFKSIVGRIRVKMSDLFIRFTDKSKQNKPVNKQRKISAIFGKINTLVTFFSCSLFNKLLFSFSRKNISIFRNKIPLIFGYRKIIDIVDCKHVAPSYCVTLWNNNNFYITKSQVLVHNCGQRSAKKFSGALILDDANKPADIRSQLMREKVLRYYEETLLSRLNNPYVPIVNIQQRLHVEDLSGLLEAKYNFKTLRKPLLDDNGVCQIPSQYTAERIKELQINNYMFSAQYQQTPIILGGQVIRREWFRYYSPASEYNYRRILITADTAMKVKEANDYSVFIVGGVTEDNKLHILEMVRGKWEAPELKKIAISLFNKYRYDVEKALACSGLYVEDKASGVGLIQELQKEGIPVVGLVADKDKLTRAESVITYIESGQVLLPDNEYYGFNPDLLNECEAFSRDDSHVHDDIVDALCYCIQEALAKTKVGLLDYFMD